MAKTTISKKVALLSLAAGVFSLSAKADADRAYSLFNPVPSDQMRDLNPDRPDITESPFTVDAGHFQIEMDYANYTHDRDKSDGGDVNTGAWSFAAINLKAGLTPDTDLQVIVNSYNVVRRKDRITGTSTNMNGFGDTTVRVKHNFWGNDGGTTAFGIMPFVKIPTNQDGLGNHSVEGGLILPFAVSLPHDWDLSAMTEVDCLRNDNGNGSHAAFVNSFSAGHAIIGNLAGYFEFYSEISAEHGTGWIGLTDFGLTYTVGKNTQFDAGVNIGVTPAAPDWNPFVGMTRRF